MTITRRQRSRVSATSAHDASTRSLASSAGRLLVVLGRYAGVLAIVILVWHLGSLIMDNQIMLPSPHLVSSSLVDIARDGSLWEACSESLRRLFTGYLLAVIICVPLGVTMGLSETMRVLFDPVVEMLRPISGLAWIPLALLLFGIGDTLVVFIIFYGAAFPIVVNAASGIQQADDNLVAAARTFGVSKVTVFLHVIFPGALPAILVGMRTAAGTAWMSLVAAELVGGGSGLGFSLDYFRQLLMSELMVAYIAVIAVLGFLTNAILRVVENWSIPWAREDSR